MIGCAVLLLGCGGGRSSSKATPDARARPVVAPDAAPPVARAATKPLLLGAGCRCTPVKPDAVLAHHAARQAFVDRMDVVHKALRRFMQGLDRAVGDEKKQALAKAGVHQSARAQLACRLDCLLAQFVGFTPSAWGWLQHLARYLDEGRRALARLGIPPDKRPPGPGLKELMARFNTVARASNRSIGIPLLAPRVPRVPVAVDSLSFRAKTRRFAVRGRTTGADFRARWLVAGAPRGTHPLAVARLVFRVQATRLQQQLAALQDEAGAILCGKGPGCKAAMPRWLAQRRALDELEKAVTAAITAAQALGAVDLPVARCRTLLAPVDKAWKAWHAALAGVRR